MTSTLENWLANGWLRPHHSSKKEIEGLCTILLAAEGYRAERTLQHYRTILALPAILGRKSKPDAQYLDACRKKRNHAEYDQVGLVSDAEVEELIEFTARLRTDVMQWLKQKHPEYSPKPIAQSP